MDQHVILPPPNWTSASSTHRESFTSNLPPEDIRVAFGLSISISIIGSIVNIITLISICRSKKLMSHSTTVFVISLTVSDLFYCLIGLPLTADTFYECYLCRVAIVCRLYAFIFYWNISVMMMNQAALAFNRYILVRNLPDSRIKFDHLTNAIILCLVWLAPFFALLIPLTGLWGSMGFDEGTGTCTMIESEDVKGSPRLTFLVTGLVLPGLIIVYCYSRIYLIVRSSKKHVNSHRVKSIPLHQTSSMGLNSSSNLESQNSSFKDLKKGSLRSKKEGRISFTLFMIFISFVICTAPPALVLAIDPNANLYPSWHIPLYAFGWCFGLINPCIYFILNASYRQAFIDFFKFVKSILLRKN